MEDNAWSVRVREVRLYERPVRLRLPFRYGAVTLREAPQAFVRLRLQTPAGEAWGTSAELLAPKWFDKNPALTDGDNANQLRRTLRLAAAAYGAAEPASVFSLAAGPGREARAAGIADGLPALAAGFGPALLDRAVLDALCRAAGVSLFQAMAANLPGADLARLAPDLAPFDTAAFLATLKPLPRIHARHTVGLLDALTLHDLGSDDALTAEHVEGAGTLAREHVGGGGALAAENTDRSGALTAKLVDGGDPTTAGDRVGGGAPHDGLPVTLEQAIARYGHRYFKLKIGGDPARDLERLERIAAVLDGALSGPYHVTLDGNEQYADAGAVAGLLAALGAQRPLRRFNEAIRFVEQPLARERALDADIDDLAKLKPVIIDESDDDLDAFVRARAHGYSGVSSKQCKGLWKSLVNAARCRRWNDARAVPRYLLSAEDLSCQAGVSVQQDLALTALLGIPHAERNGHFYGGAMPGAPAAEQHAFLVAHPDLYEPVGGAPSLRIEAGIVSLQSLYCTGFAYAAEPDFDAMDPLGGA